MLATTELPDDEPDPELLAVEVLVPVLVEPETDEVDVVTVLSDIVAVDRLEVVDVVIVLEEAEVVVLSSSPQTVVLQRYAPSKKIVPIN